MASTGMPALFDSVLTVQTKTKELTKKKNHAAPDSSTDGDEGSRLYILF